MKFGLLSEVLTLIQSHSETLHTVHTPFIIISESQDYSSTSDINNYICYTAYWGDSDRGSWFSAADWFAHNTERHFTDCVTDASHLHKEFDLWLVGHLSLHVHVFLMDPENFLRCWWKTLLLFFSSWVRSDFVSLCQWGETLLTPDRGHTPSGLTCRTSRSGSVSFCVSVLCCLCIVSVPQKHDAGSAIITIITCKVDTLLWRVRRKFFRVQDGEVKS